tara:strand:- start:111 stop:1001 length:891 start_codon:yes stop_codon:yes gene_type:complete
MNILNDQIVKNLQKHIKKSDPNKSIYWKKKSKTVDPDLIYGTTWFGSFTKTSYKTYLRYFVSYLLFGGKIFNSLSYKIVEKFCKSINREIDYDLLRHIFTFNMLQDYLKRNKKILKKICIIGDGRANALICSLKIFPNTTIFSVNLPEVLIADYHLIKKFNYLNEDYIQLINDYKNELDNKKKIILIPSNNKNFLYDQNIDLFIDIAAMQEMTQNEITEYFKIIENNKSLFYCCNREQKQLDGGEVSTFKQYEWKKNTIIFNDYCSWHNKYPTLRPPFFNFRKNKIKHCLADYKKI